MLSQLSHPAVFAHRGASAHAPENTIAAFKVAVYQGADAIELDTKLSVDGHVVVIHDQTVDRTTPTIGRVNEMTAYELTNLDAGSHFDSAFQGEPVPTLEEVFYIFGHRILINVELTNYASPFDALPIKVAQLVTQYHLQDQVLISSFNPFTLIRARKLLPEVPIALLAMQGKRGTLARSWPGRLLNYQALHPEIEDTTLDLVNRAKRRDQRVHAYTVNQVEDMRHLFEMQVDGIFTDDPQLARQVLSPRPKHHDPL